MGITAPSKEMSLPELKVAVDKLASLGTRWISFFGGEPTLRRPELLGAIEYASKSKQIFTQLPTNGFFLKDKTYVDDLGRAGVNLLDISLDSLTRFDVSKKDIFHREGLFETLFHGRDKYGYGIKTNFVLTKQNINQLEPVLEFANRNDIMISIRLAFRPPIRPSRWKEEADLYFDDNPNDIGLVDKAVETILKWKEGGCVTTEPSAFYRAMKKYVRGESKIWACDAGKNHITIDSDGTVMQCAVLLDGLGITVFDLDQGYFEKTRTIVKKNLAVCNDDCLAAAYFCAQHYRKHPLSIFRQGFLAK